MVQRRVARLAQRFLGLLHERHLYIRSGKEVHGFVLTPGHQVLIAGTLLASATWMTLATGGACFMRRSSRARAEAEVAQTQAKYERWIADREARLDSALAQLNAPSNSMVDLANTLEKRHAALAMLLTQAKDAPGAVAALAPVVSHPENDGRRRPDAETAGRSGGPGKGHRSDRFVRAQSRRQAEAGVPLGGPRSQCLRRSSAALWADR